MHDIGRLRKRCADARNAKPTAARVLALYVDGAAGRAGRYAIGITSAPHGDQLLPAENLSLSTGTLLMVNRSIHGSPYYSFPKVISMSRIQVGDTVTFRRDVVRKCDNASGLAEFRGVVTAIADQWLFLQEACSRRTKVMPVSTMCKVQRNGVVLELV